MKEIQMEYPNIEGNNLCDGTWHRISVLRLWYVVSCSNLLVMEYADHKHEMQCITILVCTSNGIMKAPLIDYSELYGAINGLLEPADPSFLPDKIEASDVSYDLTDLTLRLVQEGFTMTRRVAIADAPPPPPPPSPPDGPGCQCHSLFIARALANGKNPLPPAPMLMGGQALIVPRCRVATLFIHDSRIYLGTLDNAGLTLLHASPSVLLSILANYFIVWRHTDFSIVTDEAEVLAALNELVRESKEEGRLVTVTEIGYNSMSVRELEEIPRWVRRYAHRYEVRVMASR